MAVNLTSWKSLLKFTNIIELCDIGCRFCNILHVLESKILSFWAALIWKCQNLHFTWLSWCCQLKPVNWLQMHFYFCQNLQFSILLIVLAKALKMLLGLPQKYYEINTNLLGYEIAKKWFGKNWKMMVLKSISWFIWWNFPMFISESDKWKGTVGWARIW